MKFLHKFKAILILGRISNLPTVWSNCIAAYILSEGGLSETVEIEKFILLNLGATFLYLGGMFLNDAFDANFDRKHRLDRPIPSGIVSVNLVIFLGVVFMLAGLFCVIWINTSALVFVLCLAGSIIWYNYVHKNITWSPLIMGLCRLFLYLLAGAISFNSVDISVLIGGLMLWGYIVGLSNIAKNEATGGRINSWPCWLLLLPVVYAFSLLIFFSSDFSISVGLIFSLIIYLIWIIRSLLYSLYSKSPNYGKTVSGLLAGIVLFDLVLIAINGSQFFIIFILFFTLSLLFQRYIPAT